MAAGASKVLIKPITGDQLHSVFIGIGYFLKYEFALVLIFSADFGLI